MVRKENSEEVKKEGEGQIFLGDRSLRKYNCFVVLACEPQLPQPHTPGENLLTGYNETHELTVLKKRLSQTLKI